MYCSSCGTRVQDGTYFCSNCGASLRDEGALSYRSPVPQGNSRRAVRVTDPYRDQIAELRLQIKQLKLDLKHITTNMSSTRSQYYETSAFVPRGLLRHGYKMIEDFRLLGPQQQKQQLQQQIMQLEQQLLGLQHAQAQWKAGQR